MNDAWNMWQLIEVKKLIDDDIFMKQFGPDEIIHSSLDRAKQTALTLFPEHVSKIVESKLLNEAEPLDYIFSNKLHKRIKSFELWLSERKSNNIILVGHCHYFFLMLPLHTRLRNCDCYEFTFFRDAAGNCTWSKGVLKYRPTLSQQHPFESLMSIFTNEKNEEPSAREEDFKMCRICQVLLPVAHICG